MRRYELTDNKKSNAHDLFLNDPYLKANQPKSLFCIPRLIRPRPENTAAQDWA